MVPEDLMRKYNYGYVHSCEILNEPFIKDLIKENQELKEQFEVGEEQYNDLVEEKEKLQEQLSSITLQLEEIKLSKRDYSQENILEMKLTLKENQQQEFINYLQEELNVQIQQESIGCETTNKRYILEGVLREYKEIIGGNK